MSEDYVYHICNKHKFARQQAVLIKRRDGRPDFWFCHYGNHEIHPPESGQPQTLVKMTLKRDDSEVA